MQRNFLYRLLVVYLLAISLPILIGLGVMIPSFFLTYLKTNLVEKKLETQQAEPMPSIDQAALKAIADLKNKIRIIESAEKNKFIVSEKVINALMAKKMSQIKITGIAYENTMFNSPDEEPTEVKKIHIEGMAPSREVLLLFRKALEDSAVFKQVDLPISNFIRGSNIQFFLSLTPA